MCQDPARVARAVAALDIHVETHRQLEAIRSAAQLISSMFDEPRADVSYEEYRELVEAERAERRRRFMGAE